MGLGLVEMLFRLEEDFEIKISDEITKTFTTPRGVINYLMSLPEINKKWSRDFVAFSVWRLVEAVAGINKEDYNEDLRFIEDLRMD